MTPDEQRDELSTILDRLNQAHESVANQDEKPWWESKAIWGVLLMALSQTIRAFGYDLPFDVAHWAESLASLGTVAGLVLAWMGRVKANRPISMKRVLPGLKIP